MDSNTIDLNRAEQAVVSSLLTTHDKQQGYQPKTLQSYNNGRHVYLPLFPTKSFGPNNCLLLANVPVTHLGPHEIVRRQHGAYTSDAWMSTDNYNYNPNEGFHLSQQDAEEIATRLHVDLSIITFNAVQLRGHCYSLLVLHELFRHNVLEQRRDVAIKEPTLNSKQMALVLEFYLQIDVDIFYMKTCSFRGAEPRSMIEGLFCGKNEPEARYTLTACGNVLCQCCHPTNTWEKSQPWPVIDFDSSSVHRFVNGYTTYLNCPATCNTTNVIYTMTCPCGHYDYVDSTAETLEDAMNYHREHGNRIIHEKLTGTRLSRELILDSNEIEKEKANKMRLYQHSARCSVALRLFLYCNPIYWCFIPQKYCEAIAENTLYLQGRGGGGGGGERGERGRISDTTDPELFNIVAMGASNNERVTRYLEHIPSPPIAYAFSYLQRRQQRSFFEQFLSTLMQPLPYSSLNLYQVAIIAVLPDDRSIILRYIIETLFIIHGETKLNMICPLGSGGNPEQRYGPPYHLVWCANLDRE